MNKKIAAISLLFIGCDDNIKVSQSPVVVVDGQPNLQIEEDAINFGTLAYGSLGSESLTIKNVGTGILTIDSITVTTPFTSTSSGGVEVQPQTSTPITIQFIPTTYNDVEGSITVTSNDPDEGQVSLPIYGSVISDADGDGYANLDAGGDDCNDNDPDIHPNAVDEWYDGIDSDCAGNDDFDQDNDGFQTFVRNEDPNTGGGDCQDANDTIYPGADDQWYDGVDSNCDGRDDFDQDNDGSRSEAEGYGQDCNDFDPNVNALAIESLNGFDDNCDGIVDNDVAGWNSDLLYTGSSSGDKSGFHMTAADLNEDGKSDLIIGSPGYNSDRGHVSIFSGNSMPNSGADIEYAYNDFSGVSSSDQAGFYVGILNDFNSSSPMTLAVGSPGHNGGSGRVDLISSDEAFYFGDLEDGYMSVVGSSGNYVGKGFSQDMDINGDGMDDLVGYYSSSGNAYIYLFYGGTPDGDYTVNDADAMYATGGSAANMTRSFPNGGDINGDGLDDLLLCDGSVSLSYQSGEGAVWVLWGDATMYSNTSPQTFASVSSTGAQQGTGDLILYGNDMHASGETCGIGPDWNGDGTSEIWVFYPGSNGTFTGAYMVPGSADLVDAIYHTR
ncbi:MAG: MopE-related protein, partial [Myxococcota bacterium]|nr:MopE-related protein [Myxococcota bacterium]